MLYHISPQGGLTVLQPRVSSHQRAYVYALENVVTGLLFGAKKDDFDLILDADEAGTPEIWECRPGVFQEVYQSKSCWVYTVHEEGFRRGVTGWDPELVSDRLVPVVDSAEVPDLYQRLLEEERSGRLRLHQYEYTAEYRGRIASHIVDRIIRFDLDPARLMERDERFKGCYRPLAQALVQLTDGHLLP